MRIWPAVGQTWPSIMPMAVLFPAPLWPSNPKISASGTKAKAFDGHAAAEHLAHVM
jgi:hypothetical protein